MAKNITQLSVHISVHCGIFSSHLPPSLGIKKSREMEYIEAVSGGFKSWCKDEGYQEWDSSIFVILVELLLGKAWYYLPTRRATCLMCATAPNCVRACVCARVQFSVSTTMMSWMYLSAALQTSQ